MMIVSLRRAAVTIVLLAALPSAAAAQRVRGIVVDQTDLALPGATIEVLEGPTVTVTITTAGDGTFEIPEIVSGTQVMVKLEGFDTITVPRGNATRIVLPIATHA